MEEQKPDLAAQTRTVQMIWAAMCLTVVVYGIVLTFLLREPGTPSVPPMLHWALTAAAVGASAATFWFRRRSSLPASVNGRPAQYDAETFGELQTFCVIVWALCESIAVYGLVLAFLSREIANYLPFAALALALMIVHRPAAWPGWPARA